MRRFLAAFVLLLLPLASASSQTVKSGTRGIFFSLGLGGSSLSLDDLDGETHSGPGGTIVIGYGFTPKFALLLEGTGATLEADNGDDYVLSQGDLAARYTFANPAKAFLPYLEAAFTHRAVSNEEVEVEGGQSGEVEISGPGFSVGGGLQFFFNPKWALGASLKWTSGEFTTVRVNNTSVTGLEVDATSMRFGVGLSWYPRGTR